MIDKNIKYIPPSEESITAFATHVCERLATTRNDAKFARPEVVSGFATFLKLVMRVEAKHRSRTPEPKSKTYLSGE